MKIGFDLDDVLGDFNTLLINYHNEVYGTNFKLSDMKEYELSCLWGGTEESAIKKIFDFYETDYFKQMRPKEDAVEVIDRMSRDHDLYVITSRPIQLSQATNDWIDRYFPNKFNQVILTNHYSDHCLRKDQTTIDKNDVCLENEIKIMVEDSANWAIKCAQSGVEVFLIDEPWNQNIDNYKNIIRIESLKEISIVD